MISKLKIKNFKSIIDLEIDFEGLKTILVGQNEAGKSSILEALDAFELNLQDSDTINYECENADNSVQEISVQYIVKDDEIKEFTGFIIDSIESLMKDKIPHTNLMNLEFIPKEFPKINNYTVTRKFQINDGEIKTELLLDEVCLNKIKNSYISRILETPDGNATIDFDIDEIFKEVDIEREFAQIFHDYSPEIIFFNDFSDILPDTIEVDQISSDEEIEGKDAVRNIQTILNGTFKEWSAQKVAKKKTNTERASNEISVDFLSDWHQKIDKKNELRIEFDIQKNKEGIDVVHFFIETKEGVKLEPRKRSQGLRWFLSLWLELKAESKNRPVILLFDEPGAHLHINAMKDMMRLFDKLIGQNHQIIYSTHLPSMIDLKRYEDIKLVIHDKSKGTIIEKLTSSRFQTGNRRDALQPIAEAMGMQPLTEFSVLRQKNLIVEGLSDMFYLQAMKRILEKEDDYSIVPGIGVKDEKLNSLISFCIGYGLDWLVVIDNGYHPDVFKSQLLKSLNDESEENNGLEKVFTCREKEIEDLFTLSDMKLLGMHLANSSGKSVSELIGKRKILFSQRFKQLVEEGTITKGSLSNESVLKFEEIFGWIEASFK